MLCLNNRTAWVLPTQAGDLFLDSVFLPAPTR
ncbi:MAG: hypothetical protein ACI89L_001403 [Phycisphaerales bacterium]|jgi:hypothetical protein